jgi:hypothetical protein
MKNLKDTFSALQRAEYMCCAALTNIMLGEPFSDDLVMELEPCTALPNGASIRLALANQPVPVGAPHHVARMNSNPYRIVRLHTGNSVTDLRLNTVLSEHRRAMENAYL